MIFTCSGCHQRRNSFDRIGSICAGCAMKQIPNMTGVQYTKINDDRASYPEAAKRPCYSCGRVIGPDQGQMMQSGRVYCFEPCLNTGKWLVAEARATGKKIRTEVY